MVAGVDVGDYEDVDEDEHEHADAGVKLWKTSTRSICDSVPHT